MPDNEDQYTTIYFPVTMLKSKEQLLSVLLDIDGNLSKFVQEVASDVILAAEHIKDMDEFFKDYDWQVVAKLKERKNGKEKGKQKEESSITANTISAKSRET